jgi:multiple sugar transport system substrate-binding protein
MSTDADVALRKGLNMKLTKWKRTSIVGIGLVSLTLSTLAYGTTAGASTLARTAVVGPTQSQIDIALNTPTTLQYWSWDLSAKPSVDAFMKLHPAIKIVLNNVGVGPAQYSKLRNALAAGSGVPDVAFMEGATIPSFVLTNSLLNLSTLGADRLQRLFVPTAWHAAVLDNQVYGLPVGVNATGNFYRQDLFDQAGIAKPPVTWGQFAADAKLLMDKTGTPISAFSPNDAGMIYNLIQQAGITPFDWASGSTHVSVQLNSPEMKKLMGYWDKLLKAGYVDTTPAWGSAFWKAFDSGKIATWQAGVWGSPVLASTTKTAGKWRLSAWPLTAAGRFAAATWEGGVADVIPKTSSNPIAAYAFLNFRSTNAAFAKDKYTKYGWDPVLKSVTRDPAWLAVGDAFLGNQKPNETWARLLRNPGVVWRWLPFMEFVSAAFGDTEGKAAVDKTSLSAGLDAWQKKVSDYAVQQGFTVN